MTSDEQFEKWMDEKIPAIYQGKKVILHRYDTMTEVDEQLAKAAWIASRASLEVELPKAASARNTEVIKAVGRHIIGQGLKVKPC